MLRALSIQDVVLIERLDITWFDGLCALTGETGAGKSILLDALGLALGERSQSSLVRPQCERAIVTAEFDGNVPADLIESLSEQGIKCSDNLILRRILNADGRSRAFINDQPVSATFLRIVGQYLVEVHGQFDQLLEPASHRLTLDAYAGLNERRTRVKKEYAAWREAKQAFDVALQQRATIEERHQELMAAIQELSEIQPHEGEEQGLSDERAYLAQHHKLSEGAQLALAQLCGERGAEGLLTGAYRSLSKVAESAQGRFDEALAALDRAHIECAEVVATLKGIHEELRDSAQRLEAIEERLFKLRAVARKYRCTADELYSLLHQWQEELKSIDEGPARLETLERELKIKREAYERTARNLHEERRQAAKGLSYHVMQELPPLKLDAAEFRIDVQELREDQWGSEGIDHVTFNIRTNPGTPFGGLKEIASGGERARFMLALKAVLARARQAPTLIFDEIDVGLGGAVAHAVGERLARLGEHLQVLVITHSPQVAAVANHQWRVQKAYEDERVIIHVQPLNADERREEVARMLSGSAITAEARAAAEQLLHRWAS